MPWSDRTNAEIYDRFVRERDVYRHLNDRLAELARLPGARRVLDLACGTGATTLACLARIDRDGEVVGVDGSPAMVDVARANVHDPRASFVVGAAGGLEDAVSGTFDRVVCNAAFWQFPEPRRTLSALARRTSPRALFVFNVPAERVAGAGGTIHPFQVALARALERRSGAPFPAHPTRLAPDMLATLARESGFAVDTTERWIYRGRQEELMQLMAIPAMIGPLAGDLLDSDVLSALAEARERSDPDLRVEVPWVYWRLVRDASGDETRAGAPGRS